MSTTASDAAMDRDQDPGSDPVIRSEMEQCTALKQLFNPPAYAGGDFFAFFPVFKGSFDAIPLHYSDLTYIIICAAHVCKNRMEGATPGNGRPLSEEE